MPGRYLTLLEVPGLATTLSAPFGAELKTCLPSGRRVCVTLGVIGILLDLFSFIAGGTWSRDRAGANEDTYLLLVISTGDVLSTYLQLFHFLHGVRLSQEPH